MKEIHKIQAKINGIPTIILVDDREQYSFVTTALIRRLNLKVKRSYACKVKSPNGLIIGQAQHFSFSINDLPMSFSMDIIANKELPIIMLGKDWLKSVKARHTFRNNVLEINYKWNTIWTSIVKCCKEFQNNEEKWEVLPDEEEIEEMLIDLSEETSAPTLIQPTVFSDIFLIDAEHFQQEFSQNQPKFCLPNKEEEILSVDGMFDEIVAMYQEILEEESEIQEKAEIDNLEINSMMLINLLDDSKSDLPIENDINKKNELKECVLNVKHLNKENYQFKRKKNILEWILQQHEIKKQEMDLKEEELWKNTNHSSVSILQMSDSKSFNHIDIEYQWKRRKKLKYKNMIDADFTVPHILMY